MPSPYQFTIEVIETETEERAREQAWDSARLHVGQDRYTEIADMALVGDGYRVIEGQWLRLWVFTVEAT